MIEADMIAIQRGHKKIHTGPIVPGTHHESWVGLWESRVEFRLSTEIGTMFRQDCWFIEATPRIPGESLRYALDHRIRIGLN